MKAKPFIMQSICLAMLAFGIHLCFYSAFLQAGNLYKFGAALAVASFWFTFLSIAPFRRLERRVKERFHIPFFPYPIATLLLIVTVIVWLVLTVHYMQHLIRDAKVLYDAVTHCYDVYYGSLKGTFRLHKPEYHGVVGTWLLLDIEFILIVIMAAAFSHRHGMFLGTLPPAFAVVGGLLLGKTPTIPAMALIMCGVIGMQMAADELHVGGTKRFRQLTTGGKRRHAMYLSLLVLLLLLFGVGARLSNVTQDTCLQGEEELLRFQHSLERKAVEIGVRTVQRIQMLLGIEQPGVMSNIAPAFQGDTVLTLTADEMPSDDIYLRGFVGTKYEKGRWSNSDDIAQRFSQELCYQLLTQDYRVYQANAVAAETKRDVEDLLENEKSLSDENSMTLQVKYAKGNLSTFAYLPYFSKLSDDSMGLLMLDYDCGFRRGSDVDEYKVTLQKTESSVRSGLKKTGGILREGDIPVYSNLKYHRFNADGTSMSPDMGGRVTIFQTGGSDPFATQMINLDEEKKVPKLSDGEAYVSVSDRHLGRYIQYILNENLWLPQTGLERTRKLAKQLEESGQIPLNIPSEESGDNLAAGKVIAGLQRYFADNTSYSQILKSVGAQEDYVENFLFEQKKGYCEHYATAGAVLFRAMGIPARYVSGYKIAASDFKRDEDGTYTAKVPDYAAHAWTEVYTLNHGWTVADMTPGADSADASGGEGLNGNYYARPTAEQDFHDDAFLDEESESVDGISQEEETSEPEETEEAEPEETMSSDLSDAGGQDGDKPSGGAGKEQQAGPRSSQTAKHIILAVAIIVAVLSLWMLWYSQKWRRRRYLKSCGSNYEYVLELNRQLEQYLNCCGYRKVSSMSDTEYMNLLEQIYPKGAQDGRLGAYYSLLERARFDKGEGGREEIRSCSRFVRTIKNAALVPKNVFRRIYVQGIRGW